jgi:hypothetical protein
MRALAKPSRESNRKARELVFKAVVHELQQAEEIGGPEGLEYERLMVDIAAEATSRLAMFLKGRCVVRAGVMSRESNRKARELVFKAVVHELQQAEEIGGPEGLEYERLMVDIAAEATSRLATFLKNKTEG